MTSKSKAKGTYHENYFVKLFKEWGLKVRKQPLSGALGGEYSGDLVITINGEDYITEVKYRKEKGFPSPFTVLKNRDVALFKLGKNEEGSPKWVLIIPDYIVEKFIGANK
jgi:Holliday junction resolvase|tara:strand:+ start:603 stop:932 length:330 start_codon:yes stop_codon:yes gene_type:complete